MAKHRHRRHGPRSNTYAAQAATAPSLASPPARAEAFTFGDPVAVLDRRELLDYIECWEVNGKYYEPPLSWDGLAKSFRAAVHHSSPIYLKRNILVATYRPHPLLSRQDFAALVLDFQIFGNAYLERIGSRTGKALALRHALAKYMRRGIQPGRYWWVRGWKDEHEFAPGSVLHLREPDINQEIYGLPEYLAALNSTWLNESATLFRRRYYKNGSHAGFIFYMTDAAQNQTDVDNLREAMKNAKGPGNFRNLFMYAPNGKKDGIQIIPVAEVAAKDEFWNIKNVTRDDQLAAHRVPPQLLGIMPNNTSGFGDVGKAAAVMAYNEIGPLQARFKEINDWMGEEVVRFAPFEIPGLDGAPSPEPIR
ncbi:phage portal protein [Thauera butanivorans]|uniref:phage portal protein n=1 Tax=Thauera butanivorans TaxID=86174 RepID=UPI00083960A2|nr:phage portal protein [Thauera butanivorans]